MARYNYGNTYNDKYNSFYNSSPRVIVILDSGIGVDSIVGLNCNITISDAGVGGETIGINAAFLVSDSSSGSDAVALVAYLDLADAGQGEDIILPLNVEITISDAGQGIEFVAPAKLAFLIDADNILQPLGVYVTGDSREDLLPSIRDYSAKILGKHGEILLSTKFEPRILELSCISSDGLSLTEREQLKRFIAKTLNPTAGAKMLAFSDDLSKGYNVKYSGKIDLTQKPDWFEFVLPFKLSNPYILETFEQTFVGSGTITNSGTADAFLTIEIAGPDTNPSITVGSYTLTYSGAIADGETLIINTEKMTAELDGVNVFENYNGVFPKLPPGDTQVTAGNNVIFKWRGRWI